MIPGGASTGSKQPMALWGATDGGLPTEYASAGGCRITLADGRTLVDATAALGAVALGYAHPAVTARVIEAVRAGNVAGLAHRSEGLLAERLGDLIPCAESVRFLKSGAEGVAAAVRIARALTGRDLVIGSGYFGWLDWWSDVAGVPAGVRRDFRPVRFDEVPDLEREVRDAGSSLAAIVIEPLVEREPSRAWLQRARDLATRTGAVLVFDEMKTGVRMPGGSCQAASAVTPDIAVFGKALANGFPLSAVVGRREVMDAVQRTWVSSTLAGETAALAAAHAVLDVAAEMSLPAVLRETGERQMRIARDALAGAGIAATVEGVPQMWFVRFSAAEAERTWLAACCAHGVLVKRGAYNFPMLAHDHAALGAFDAGLHAAARDVAAAHPAAA